ncbi:MAG: cupin domain-containing protein [Ktedonobacteraceae bacterium]
MSAPPGWHEPSQIAEFDEVVIVLQGALAVEADNQRIEVRLDETCLIDRGTKVTYSNASQYSPCVYWSLGLPAFRPERTHMEEH